MQSVHPPVLQPPPADTVRRAGGRTRKRRARPALEARGRHFYEWVVKGICAACALASVTITLGIIAVLAGEAWQFFRQVSIWTFLTGREWQPLAMEPKFGVLPLLSGTLLITVGSGLIAIPTGLLAGIYLSEYARPGVRRALKPMLELLAGVPTVVYGYFALFFVTPIMQKLAPGVQSNNAASGAIVVGIMTLPLVSSLCEDALRSVPRSMREGAYALGATKLEVTAKIVVPGALSGVMASFILALSRAIGETMAVALAAGATPNLTLNPIEPIQTMTAYIVQVSKGDVPRGTLGYQTIFAVGAALFVITLGMNLLAQRLVRRYRRVYA